VSDEKQQRPLLVGLVLAIFIVFLDTRVVAPLLPNVAASFDVSIPRAGWLISSYAVPYGLFQLIYGPIADRFGKIRVIAVAMILFSIGTFFCGLTGSFGATIALRAITGAAAAAVFPLTLAYVGDTVPYANRQATIAMLVASTGMANSLSTASGAVIAQALSWQWVFPVFGAIGAAITIYLIAVANREQRVAAKVGAASAYKTALRSRPLMLLVALAFVEGSLYFGGFSYLGAMLSERYVISTIGVGAMLSIVGVAQLITASFVPRLVKRLREAQIIALGAFAMGLSFVTAAITPSSFTFPASMVLLGAGFSLCHSTLQTRASEVLPGLRGTSIALFAFALFLGNGIGTLAIGELIAAIGYTATIVGAGVAFWLFAWAAAAYMARPKA